MRLRAIPKTLMDYRVPEGLSPSGKIYTYKGAYITLSYHCNLDTCEYCYARAQAIPGLMSLEDFKRIISWLQAVSDFPVVQLVGGEPTLVPNFDDYLDVLRQSGYEAIIYTNGSFSSDVCELLAEHSAVACVIFHYEESLFSSFAGLRQLWMTNLENLAQRKSVRMIYTADAHPDFYGPLAVAERYRIPLDWIFATPTAGYTPYVGLARMKALGPLLEAFLLEAQRRGVVTNPDLPIPLCIFTEEFLDRYCDTFRLARSCTPFVYFKPDLSIQFCTAMPCIRAGPITHADKLRRRVLENRRIRAGLGTLHSFEECSRCKLHPDVCQGGCLTYKVYKY